MTSEENVLRRICVANIIDRPKRLSLNTGFKVILKPALTIANQLVGVIRKPNLS